MSDKRIKWKTCDAFQDSQTMDHLFYCVECMRKYPLKDLRVPEGFSELSGLLVCPTCRKGWTAEQSEEHRILVEGMWDETEE